MQGSGAPNAAGSGALAGHIRVAGATGFFVSLVTLVALLVSSAPAVAASEGCPNEARREEQGAFGRALPNCRAYELVTQPYQPAPFYFHYFEGVAPLNGTFQYEWGKEPGQIPEEQSAEAFARDGDAVLFGSDEPNNEGDGINNNLSRRTPNGWVGENIEPTQSRHGWLCGVTGFAAGSENLEKFIFRDAWQENEGGGTQDYIENCGHDEPRLAPGENEESANLFLRDTTTKSWELVDTMKQQPETKAYDPWFEAISPDGSHVVFSSRAQYTPEAPFAAAEGIFGGGPPVGYCNNEFGDIYVSSGGQVHLLPILPGGTPARGTLAGAHPFESGCTTTPEQSASFTHSVSPDGERILFYAGGGFKFKDVAANEYKIAPYYPYIHGGLYLREHPGADQSALADGGAAGEGTVTSGSTEVTSLVVAAGNGALTKGSNEVTEFAALTGEFAVGQPIAGEGIPAGTTITGKSATTLTLSNAATENWPSYNHDQLTSEGPEPFAVGQTIVGAGIPTGTKITAVGLGSLTLSAAATASGGEVSLESLSNCTEPQKACTTRIDVPEGGSGAPGEGQFQWANSETTKIFFTDIEKLTSDSTAEAGKPDLYEYDLEKPEGHRLTDLTATTSGEPANVLGVSGASEDGSYIYFAAEGNLTGAQRNSRGDTAVGESKGAGTLGGVAKFTANLQSFSNQLTEVNVSSGTLHIGQEITGQYIREHATVTACSPSCSAPTEVTMSESVNEAAYGEELTGAGSTEITGVTTASGAFKEGMTITGNGIPANSWITEVGNGTLTISHGVTTNGPVTLSATGANLYMLHGGAFTFITDLSPIGGDVCDWEMMCLTSQVSANGRFIAFNSVDELTGYDNRPVQPRSCGHMHSLFINVPSGLPCPEAYRYSAEAGEHGEVTCASCNPTGEPPQSEFGWAVIQQAAHETGTFNYAKRLNYAVTNNGEVYFETMEGLAPGDENETWDVYQYDGGEGANAQLHLISTGKDELPSYFMGSTPNGSDAFFVTDQSLVRGDTKSDFDIYDARVDGGFPEPLKPACDSPESCHGAGTIAPTTATPSSAVFSGVEEGRNHLRCEKGDALRHGKCVRKHRKHQKHSRHRKHSRQQRSSGRAGR